MWRQTMVLVAAASLTACSWVNLTPEGEKVRVLTAADVAKCQSVGKTTVSLMSTVAGMDRHPNKVQDELNVLARNSAVDLHGDTVVAITPVSGGKQTFAVYRCMPH